MLSKVEIRNQAAEYRNTGIPETGTRDLPSPRLRQAGLGLGRDQALGIRHLALVVEGHCAFYPYNSDILRNRGIKQRKSSSTQCHQCQMPNAKCLLKSAIGFTLIELLVVVTIIALLVGILVPSVSMTIREAANAKTSARVAELAGGCMMYHTQNEYYPGQGYSGELAGSGGNFTGSQWLAKSLFYDSDATPKYPQPQYALLKASEDLIDPKQSDSDGFNIGTISDRNTAERETMPILYYPARLGESGLGQYKEADNTTHTSGRTGGTFSDFIKDERFDGSGSTTPYSPKKFLIIAAGKDRKYFTDDDIRYPAFGGE